MMTLHEVLHWCSEYPWTTWWIIYIIGYVSCFYIARKAERHTKGEDYGWDDVATIIQFSFLWPLLFCIWTWEWLSSSTPPEYL